MLSPAQIRERLRAAAHSVFSMDDGVTAEAAEWLAGLSARDLLRVDGFARQWRVGGPTLGKAQQWTKEVLQHPEIAAAIGAMHADGFVRERSLRRLAASRSTIAMRTIAVRAQDHVHQVRAIAQEQLAQRTAHCSRQPRSCRAEEYRRDVDARAVLGDGPSVYFRSWRTRADAEAGWEFNQAFYVRL